MMYENSFDSNPLTLKLKNFPFPKKLSKLSKPDTLIPFDLSHSPAEKFKSKRYLTRRKVFDDTRDTSREKERKKKEARPVTRHGGSFVSTHNNAGKGESRGNNDVCAS